jgi:hypothetical protein
VLIMHAGLWMAHAVAAGVLGLVTLGFAAGVGEIDA